MLVLGLWVSCSTTELRCTKNLSLDNQFKVVEERKPAKPAKPARELAASPQNVSCSHPLPQATQARNESSKWLS